MTHNTPRKGSLLKRLIGYVKWLALIAACLPIWAFQACKLIGAILA